MRRCSAAQSRWAAASTVLRRWVEQHNITLNIGSFPLGHQLEWLPAIILYYMIFQVLFIYLFHRFVFPLIREYNSASGAHKFWLGAAGFLFFLAKGLVWLAIGGLALIGIL